MVESGKRPYPGRLTLIIAFVTLWSLCILARLVQLQAVRHQEFAQRAIKGQTVTRPVLAPRGIIYDAHMDELATTVLVRRVDAEPRRIRDIPLAARELASILQMDQREVLARLSDPGRQAYQVVKHRIDPKAEARIEGLNIDGIYLIEESMRVYPNLALACHALGFVNMNGDGGAGLELQYDKLLKGQDGVLSFDVDARGRSFRGRVEKPPEQGHSLVLSIDRSIQYLTAKALAEGVEKTRAASGVAIVMESETGRVIALAHYPDFNCNTYNEYAPELLRNRAVSDFYEPGSTFKVVVAAAALEAGLTRPNEIIDCQMGAITIARHIFHDHKPYGLLTFSQVLENSSNVGAAKLGLRLGNRRLYEALRKLGFGSRTGVDLPAETTGLVRDWHQWSGLSIGAISFGQEVGVSSIQIVTAINAIANGGYKVQPSLVDRVIDHNGELIRTPTPTRVQVMRPETAAAIRDAFEGVVLRGTGRQAALEGYRAAGKTGTAQKIVDGRYSNTKYLASFVGFAPLPNPKLTILVWIDEPRGQIYGGEVAAPVFQKIAQQALLQLHVPPDKSLAVPRFNRTLLARSAEDYRPNATPVLPMIAMGEGDKPGGYTDDAILVPVDAETVLVPDFHGLPKRAVLNRCQELGLQLQASGSGVAVFQLPAPGTKIPLGDLCQVTFARAAAESRARVPGLWNQNDSVTQRAAGVPGTATARP